MKRILSIIVLIAVLLSAFSIPTFAEDNAQSGDGDTHGAVSGYAWYNTYEYLWKVTLYVGKSDQASTSSNLQNDFYRIGTVVMKKTGWLLSSTVKFGSGTKVDYYSGAPMTMDASPIIITDVNCPKIPIVCDGNIETVKAYFGSTGTMSTILNAIAKYKGTTAESMLSKLSFSIGGRTQTDWDYSYIDPNGTSNRVPWVIVYEPMVILNLKDKVTELAFTATEFALCELNGWYDWNLSGGKGQNCAILPERHMPTSVQLEESWFGYPVYAVTDDTQKWDYNDVVKGGGWGMRWLPVAVKEPEYKEIDYGTYFGEISTPVADGYGSVVVNWVNYKSETGTVLCELYRGDKKIWARNQTIEGGCSVQGTFSIYFPGTDPQTITTRINYENRNEETDPDDNMQTCTITPTVAEAEREVDFGVYVTEVEQPEQDNYGKVSLKWNNWTDSSDSALCEVYLDGELIYSATKDFEAYGAIEQTLSVYYSGISTRVIEARINYAYKDDEIDPNDNSATEMVTPTQIIDTTYDFSVSEIKTEPSKAYQGELIKVSFVSDNWNKDIAYKDILVEVLAGDKVLKSDYVDFSEYGHNSHTYYISMTSLGAQPITARINWENRYGENNSFNNSISCTAVAERYKDFSVSDLQVTPTTCYERETVKITFRTDSWDKYNSYNHIPVELFYDGELVYYDYFDYDAYIGKNHTITLGVGYTAGVNDVMVRVNWDNRDSEVNTTNNETETIQLTVKPRNDLTIEAIEPNSDYRQGMTVVTSYRIYNRSYVDVVPTQNCTVSFEAYYYDGTAKVIISSQAWEQAVVPSYDSNLVYFKWTVPATIGGKTVYCHAQVDSGIDFDEYSTLNNDATLIRTVARAKTSYTPDTKYEEAKPSDYSIPATPSKKAGSAKWSMWTYSDGTFVKKTYGVAISSSTPSITPDEDSPSAEYKSGKWQMRSGYGIYLNYTPTITSYSSYTMPSPAAYTDVQRVEVTFPEFNYSTTSGKYRSAENVGGVWVFAKNSSADSGERLHFTPIWYPNGNYIASVTATDVWTPAGMISSVRNSNTMNIVDSAYDDWYVGEEV